MKAKKITQNDRDNLHRGHTKYYGLNTQKQNVRLLDLGLIELTPVGTGSYTTYSITERGLQEIQEPTDKAAADKLAREAEYDEYDRKEKQAVSELRSKFSEAGIDTTNIEWIGHNWGYGGRPNTFDVDFKMTCVIAFDREEKRYYISARKGSGRAIDIDALIREAQDARTVAGILNSMLEGEQS